MAPTKRSRDDYTVAWICALPHEMTAGKAMLDHIHDRLPQPKTDVNSYTLGTVCGHNVVMVCLPSGGYGTNSAAAVVTRLQSTFPRIQYGLMVGIGGGAPSRESDIRLGDVVVGLPGPKHSGVIQYDFGKTLAGGTSEPTGTLNRPPEVLLGAISNLRSEHTKIRKRISTLIEEKLGQNREIARFACPGHSQDRLFESSYEHPPFEDNCSECDVTKLVNREPRDNRESHIFYGLIASGNQVMKDGLTRDTWARQSPILCFEMEAAGIVNLLPCLVIRGICDYSDSHKNKKWQGYSALTAAAFTRILMAEVPLAVAMTEEKQEVKWKPREQQCLQDLFLIDNEDTLSSLRRRKGGYAPGTCTWILETEELSRWLGETAASQPNILWLKGNPGVGKSTLSIAMAEHLPLRPPFNCGAKTLLYFFCESSSEKQRTAISILRGLLYQLVQKHPALIEYLIEKYDVERQSLFSSFDGLWNVLMKMGKHQKEIYCILDALDECDQESQNILLTQINQTFGNTSCSDAEHGIYFLITSRPYEEIERHLCVFNNHDLSTFEMLKRDITALIDKKVEELDERNKYPATIRKMVSEILEEKADGTFLWVGIACDEIRDTRPRDVVKTLQKLPTGLDSLYRNLLDTAEKRNLDEFETIIRILSLVAVALRPLKVSDLVDAAQIYPENDQEERLSFIRDDINMCRLLIIVQDDTISLLHKSLKDFLLKESPPGGSPVVDEEQAHAAFAYSCLDHVILSFKTHSIYAFDGGTPFISYAAKYWPEHAHFSGSEFHIKECHKKMFSPDSDIRDKWQDYLHLKRFIDSWTRICSSFHIASRWGIAPLARYAISTNRLENMGNSFSGSNSPVKLSAEYGHCDILSLFLNARAKIDERVLISVVKNPRRGKDMLNLLLTHHNHRFNLTQSIIDEALRWGNRDIVELLLHHDTRIIGDMKHTMNILSNNYYYGAEILSLLFEQLEEEVVVTEEMALLVANCRDINLMGLLLDRAGSETIITGQVIQAVVNTKEYGLEMMNMLIRRLGDKFLVPADLDLFITGWDEEMAKLVLGQMGNAIPSLDGLLRRDPRPETDRAWVLLLTHRRDHIDFTSEMFNHALASGNEEVMRHLFAMRGITDLINGETIRKVAQRGTDTAIALLIKHFEGELPITEEVVAAAAGNATNGPGIMRRFLEKWTHSVPVTTEVVEAAATNYRSGDEILQMLLIQVGGRIDLVEDILVAATKWRLSGVMEIICRDFIGQLRRPEHFVSTLAEYGTKEMAQAAFHYEQVRRFLFTQETMLSAAANLLNATAILEFLLDHSPQQLPVSEEVLRVAISSNHARKLIKLFLPRPGCKVSLTPDMIHTAAFYAPRKPGAMADLVASGANIPLTPDILQAVAEHAPVPLFRLLLDQYGNRIQMTEELLLTIANRGRSLDLLKLLLKQKGASLPFSEEIIETIIRKDTFLYILEVLGEKVPITEEAIIQCLRKRENSEAVQRIFQRMGDRTPSRVLVEAVARYGDQDLFSTLLNEFTGSIQINQSICNAAAANQRFGKDIMSLILQDYSADISMIQTLHAAIQADNHDMIKFLQQGESKIDVAPDMLLSAATKSWETIGALLFPEVEDVTQDMVGSAVGAIRCDRLVTLVLQNSASGWKCHLRFTESLIYRLGGKKMISEDVITAAAENPNWGKRNMEVILSIFENYIEVTERIAMAAARNWGCGCQILKMLGDKMPVTTAILEAVASQNRMFVTDDSLAKMRLLLDLNPHILITEAIIKAAVLHSNAPMLKLLFLRRRREILITEHILTTTFRCRIPLKNIQVLARNKSHEVQNCLTENILTIAAAGGHLDILLFFRTRFGSSISTNLQSICQLRIAAADGHLYLVDKLLRQGTPPNTKDANGCTPLWVAVKGNHFLVVTALLKTRSVDLNAIGMEVKFKGPGAKRTPLIVAVKNNHAPIVRALLEAGADPNIKSSKGETAYSIARSEYQLRIMSLLQQYGARIGSD